MAQPVVEQARTVLEKAYPTGVGSPATLGEDTTVQNTADNAYQQPANVVILVSLPIAGCRLAAGVAAGWPTASARLACCGSPATGAACCPA
jgi:hypothetical protein